MIGNEWLQWIGSSSFTHKGSKHFIIEMRSTMLHLWRRYIFHGSCLSFPSMWLAEGTFILIAMKSRPSHVNYLLCCWSSSSFTASQSSFSAPTNLVPQSHLSCWIGPQKEIKWRSELMKELVSNEPAVSRWTTRHAIRVKERHNALTLYVPPCVPRSEEVNSTVSKRSHIF